MVREEALQDHVHFRKSPYALRQGVEDVDKVDALLREMGGHIVTPAQEGHWAPGYYYVLCEDPDGIRVEVNHVPGQGVLADDAGFNPGDNFHA